jgi:hypothetical protein
MNNSRFSDSQIIAVLKQAEGGMMSLLFVNGEKGPLLVVVSLISILVLSFALTSISDQWLKPLRNRVRNNTPKVRRAVSVLLL